MGSFHAPDQTSNPIQLVDFARYVKEVTVEHDKLIDGQLMAKVSGTIDTAGLADGALSRVSGTGTPDLDYLEGARRHSLDALPLRGDVPADAGPCRHDH
jgi:hypothetical protein